MTTNRTPLVDLHDLWKRLGRVACDDYGHTLDDVEFAGLPGASFPAGTDRNDIFQWFEALNPNFVVGEAMEGTFLRGELHLRDQIHREAKVNFAQRVLASTEVCAALLEAHRLSTPRDPRKMTWDQYFAALANDAYDTRDPLTSDLRSKCVLEIDDALLAIMKPAYDRPRG